VNGGFAEKKLTLTLSSRYHKIKKINKYKINVSSVKDTHRAIYL